MKKHFQPIVFIIWVIVLFGLIIPFTPPVVSSFVAGGGSGVVFFLAHRYKLYGKDGLKFWKGSPAAKSGIK